MGSAAAALPVEAAPSGPLTFCDDARTAYIVAGGESVLDAPLERLPAGATIAVTDAWRLVPDAAALYAADPEWYYVHREDVARGFAGERWCARLAGPVRAIQLEHGKAAEAAIRAQMVRDLQLRSLPGDFAEGLSAVAGRIHLGSAEGRNSVAQTCGYAEQWGTRRLVLIGVDLQGGRYFGQQAARLRYKTSNYPAFQRVIERVVADLVRRGVEVINCSPVSRIAGATHRPLDELLPPPPAAATARPAPVTCLSVTPRPGGSNPRLARAFARGAGGRVLRGPRLDGAQSVFLFGDPELWPALKAAQALGRTWYYADHGYMGRGAYYRITRNAYQHDGVSGVPDHARLQRLGITPAPWRRSGRTVLLCPPDQDYTRLFDFSAEQWRNEAMAELQRYTDRPIVVRERGCSTSLAGDLADAHVLVTWRSNAAVDALLAGVPVICTGECAARPMGRTQLADVERPLYPDDRDDWAARLAANQWTLDEMASGMAWRALQPNH